MQHTKTAVVKICRKAGRGVFPLRGLLLEPSEALDGTSCFDDTGSVRLSFSRMTTGYCR